MLPAPGGGAAAAAGGASTAATDLAAALRTSGTEDDGSVSRQDRILWITMDIHYLYIHI